MRISKDGLYALEWNSNEQAWQPTHKPKPDTIFTQLRHSCEIAEGTTLRDIFRMVDEYPTLKCFLSEYTWSHEYLDQLHLSLQLPPEKTNLTHIVLAKYADEELPHVERVKHKGGKREVIIGIPYHVHEHICAVGTDDDNPELGALNYNIGCCRMTDIADLPIHFSTKFTVSIPVIPGTENTQRKENPKLFETEQDFSLLEILDVLYWELTFYGGPEDHERGII